MGFMVGKVQKLSPIFTRGDDVILLHRGQSSRLVHKFGLVKASTTEQIITRMKIFHLLKCFQEYNPALIMAKIYRATGTCWVDSRTGPLVAYRRDIEYKFIDNFEMILPKEVGTHPNSLAAGCSWPLESLQNGWDAISCKLNPLILIWKFKDPHTPDSILIGQRCRPSLARCNQTYRNPNKTNNFYLFLNHCSYNIFRVLRYEYIR